jgi:hypothetical protein
MAITLEEARELVGKRIYSTRRFIVEGRPVPMERGFILKEIQEGPPLSFVLTYVTPKGDHVYRPTDLDIFVSTKMNN